VLVADAISASQLGLVSVSEASVIPDSGDLFVSEPPLEIAKEARLVPSLSTLGELVGDVVCVRTDEQVSRVHARRVVTSVEHVQPERHWFAGCNLYSNTMRTHGNARTLLKNSVPVLVPPTEPFPALVGRAFDEVTPKAYGPWCAELKRDIAVSPEPFVVLRTQTSRPLVAYGTVAVGSFAHSHLPNIAANTPREQGES